MRRYFALVHDDEERRGVELRLGVDFIKSLKPCSGLPQLVTMPSILPSFTAAITSFTCSSTGSAPNAAAPRIPSCWASATASPSCPRAKEYFLLCGVDQPGIVHEQGEYLVVLVFVAQRAVRV